MKIVIKNVVFPYDLGCRALKLGGGNSPFPQLNDFWDEIQPLDFSEIAQLQNLEQRRIAISYFGIDRIVSDVSPKLVSSQTLKKQTHWITEDGKEETINFDDTYELYKVDSEKLLGQKNLRPTYYVRCKDTSTDREYLIWVDIQSVYLTNNPKMSFFIEDTDVNAIQAIAWTIRTNVPQGNIEKIVRQGDCILIKPKDSSLVGEERHLTEEEYKTLLVLES